MEDGHRAKHGEGVWSFCALPEHALFPNLPVFTSLAALKTPSFWVFLWRLHYLGMID